MVNRHDYPPSRGRATGFVSQNPADDAYVKAMTQSDPPEDRGAKSFLQQFGEGQPVRASPTPSA
jgi:hypothetical protein